VKILFVVEQYAEEGSRYYREFFRQLKRMGAAVVVVNINRSPAFRDEVSELVDGYHSLGLNGKYHRSLPALRRILHLETPSLVQGMEIIPSFYAALALATLSRKRPPLVYGRRHGLTEGGVARVMDWVAFLGARRVIVVSEEMARVAREEHPRGKGKVVAIWSGVSLEQRAEPTEKERTILASLTATRAYSVLLLARIRPIKGHGVALQATEVLKKRGIPIRLLLVGEGRAKAAVEAEVRARGLDQEVVFTGHVEDIRRVLELADVMIIPSFGDAFPKVAVEAFAAGVPVVASAVGGLKELITPGKTGFLVEPDNAEALADALAHLKANPDKARQVATNAREVYRTELTPEIMVKRYLQEYQQLIGEI